MKEIWAEGRLGKRSAGQPRVIFGQVHKDAACELAAAREVPALRRCVVIGSGGCTAFTLLASGAEVDAIDINPAQIYLIEAKRAALRLFSPDEIRQAFEVDARPLTARLASRLSGDANRFWEKNRELLRDGFLRCGVVEQNLRRAMRLFFCTVQSRREAIRVLAMVDPEAQKTRFQERWADWRWHTMFKLAFHPWLLRLVYGAGVVRRLPSNAAQSVRENLETVLIRLPARDNGYLWQTFLQSYPLENEAARPLYLQPKGLETIRERLDYLRLQIADVATWLTEQPPGSVDFFALSNILELAPRQFSETLAAQVLRAASPGAIVVTRRIFAVEPEVPHAGLLFDSELSVRLNAMDRSPVCRHIRVYRARK